MNNKIYLESVVEVKLKDLDIHVEDGDFVSWVETKVQKHINYDTIFFYPTNLEELQLVAEDINTIQLSVNLEKNLNRGVLSNEIN